MISAHWLSVNHCQRFPLFVFTASHIPHGEIGNLYDFLYQLRHLKVSYIMHWVLFKGIPVSSAVVPLNLPLFPGGNLPSWIPPWPLTHIFLRCDFAASYIVKPLFVSIAPHPAPPSRGSAIGALAFHARVTGSNPTQFLGYICLQSSIIQPHDYFADNQQLGLKCFCQII